jgi:hypothetical protein
MPFASARSGPGTDSVQRDFDRSGPSRVEMPLVSPPSIARQVSETLAQRADIARAVEINELNVRSTVDSNSSGAQESSASPASPDLDDLTEKVWQRIRRKLRIERERSRGIV